MDYGNLWKFMEYEYDAWDAWEFLMRYDERYFTNLIRVCLKMGCMVYPPIGALFNAIFNSGCRDAIFSDKPIY